jgi:hypothetical protein
MSVDSATGSYQALYRACIKEAAMHSRSLMQRMVSRAHDALQRTAAHSGNERERQFLFECARTLTKHEASLGESYPQALLAEFAQAIAGDTRKVSAVSFDSLELMGDDQMRENVDQMRVLQQVSSTVDAELTELNALISSVQGLKSVQPDRNPLRPDVYVRSLRSVVMQSPIPAPMRTRWMLFLGEALGPELARGYGELAAWMRGQGVTEAKFQAVIAPDAPAAPDTKLLNLHELRKLIAGDLEDITRDGGRATDFGMTMPAAVDALENMKQVDMVVERMKARQRKDAQALAEGKVPTREPAQVLSQEVVRLMLDTIANDARLLPPVQQCVRELEPALLRLALDDPRFFSDKRHPARRLLDELTQRSLAFESATSPGFNGFIEPLQQAVEVLRETRVPGAEPFDFAVKTLEDAWAELTKRDRHHREKAVRALLNAEQRNLLAGKLADGLRHRPDLQGAPNEIVAFVTGPWAQVIAQARLADTQGSHDPGGHTALLTDLVWSAQPHVVGAQSSRLLKLVPQLVEQLRHGLATVDYPPQLTERFLDYLAHLHRLALRGPMSEARITEPPKLSREDLESMMGAGDDSAWLAPGEAQDSGFMDTHATLAPKNAFPSTQGSTFTETKPHEDDAMPEVPIDGLQPGAWVEMMTANGWQRFQVTWASPHGTLFMFTGKGGQPQSMTRRLLGKMLKSGALKLISRQAVVDGALDAVAEKALRNSAG